MSVRSEILAWYHLSDTHGLHSSLDATLGRMLGRYYWPTIVSDTEGFISKCNVCKKLRGHVLISPTMRSTQYDAPFVTIFFDYAGHWLTSHRGPPDVQASLPHARARAPARSRTQNDRRA